MSSNPSHGITLVKYGYLHVVLEKYEEAERLIKEGIEVLEKADHKFWLMTGRLHLAQLYIKTGRKNRALEILKNQVKICREENWYYREIQALAMIDEVNSNNKNREKVKKLIDKIESPKVANRLRNNFGF